MECIFLNCLYIPYYVDAELVVTSRDESVFILLGQSESTYLTHKHIKLDPHSSHFLARPLSAKPGAVAAANKFFFDTPALAAFYIILTSGSNNSRFRLFSLSTLWRRISLRRQGRSLCCVPFLQANNTDWVLFFAGICCCRDFQKRAIFLSRVDLIY